MLTVKESSIKNAGVGVFAKKNIKKRQIVCYYDVREFIEQQKKHNEETTRLLNMVFDAIG